MLLLLSSELDGVVGVRAVADFHDVDPVFGAMFWRVLGGEVRDDHDVGPHTLPVVLADLGGSELLGEAFALHGRGEICHPTRVHDRVAASKVPFGYAALDEFDRLVVAVDVRSLEVGVGAAREDVAGAILRVVAQGAFV